MMQDNPYYTYKEHMKKLYGKPLYSIPIDLDLGCPNRESDGTGGCTFCPENGARASQTLDASNVQEQIKAGVEFAKNRYKAEKFMLYIQAYTGTFTSVMNQKKIYSDLLKQFEFDAISIGTRPDCLNLKTLEYLQELNNEIDVHIDLGVQSLNDITLKKINRGHDCKCSLDAISKLKEYGIKVYAHIIVGLEGETRSDWELTVKKLVDANVDGIKIHNLHIIKNTLLANEYESKPFKTLNEYEYANEVIHLLRHIPNHIPIIRVNTDTPEESLIAPIWHMGKGQFSEYIKESMLYRDVRQGDLVEEGEPISIQKYNTFNLVDGSITVWDKKYKDYYHPKSGAYRSARELFIMNSQLEELLKNKDVKLLDIGFGMGYNSIEALKLEKKNKLSITALDKNRAILNYAQGIGLDEVHEPILKSIYETGSYEDDYNEIELIVDDARSSAATLSSKYDVIFLDPFTHNLNPSLITEEFILLISKLLKEDGKLVSSSNNDMIKTAFSKAGLTWNSCDIERTDIKGLVAIFGEQKFEGASYKDSYLIARERLLISQKEGKMSK